MRASAARREAAKQPAAFRVSLVQMVAAAALVTGVGALLMVARLSGTSMAKIKGAHLPNGHAGFTPQIHFSQESRAANNPAFRIRARTQDGAPAAPPARANVAEQAPVPQAGAAAVAQESEPWVYKFQTILVPSASPRVPMYNTRGCTCSADWRTATGSVCTCGGVACGPEVNPQFLTDAWGQEVCSLTRRTGSSCYTRCTADGKVLWFAEGCGAPGQPECPPLVVSPSATPTQTGSARPSVVVPRTTWQPSEVYDFRGGGCELLNGKQQCYMEDGQGREMCPDYVTIDYMTQGPPEYPQCKPENSVRNYCTIICQEGNPVVRWGVHDVEDCYRPENIGNCPPRPKVVPKNEFKWVEWSEKKRPEKRCQRAARMGAVGSLVPELTVGLLTHEPRSFAESMASYERNGLFDIVPEFLIFINNRNAETDAVADRYKAKYPGKVRVLGDAQNQGIARGLVALTDAASQPYFLFLERDFFLIEPATCAAEELQAGVDLLKAQAAHVVRYRHRWRAGRPNWAYRFFVGHEDDGFRGRQPNLGCNAHYWVEGTVARWPQFFWECGRSPEMICSDAYYCNWTNNPQMWSIAWWNKEYVHGSFEHQIRLNPYDDLESWMNWEPNSWNDRGWTVAQGEGLFKHRDLGNIVHV